jgi:hypothetical protein
LTRWDTGDYSPDEGPGAATSTSDPGYVLFTNAVLAKRVATGREIEPNALGAMATGFAALQPEENDEITVDGTVYRVADSNNYMQIGALFELMLVAK